MGDKLLNSFEDNTIGIVRRTMFLFCVLAIAESRAKIWAVKYLLKRNLNATVLDPPFLPHGPHDD